ncbi:iron-containing alcohol dehydrogenase [Bradyrhizobium sp. CW7]|uniref:iron-containing alcohol dehydrogenase n=1 Tax=Bradyrhizobium sp. CW7 TaxID=2782688 RepID=UPI001FF7F608|nr:iron-containing alcohol dehydrogenase [Bradyrhizobium sp. CW7]MCK1354250.1 iron-containing alcohol dehydrogenase [Bradyrhizobium sp. CW7]
MTRDVQAGIVNLLAQSIVFGKPAHEVVAAEAARRCLRRVFVTSTRSLALLGNGPLQKVVKAVGDRYAGQFTAIGAHSPDHDIVAAANAARQAGAEVVVAVGGGSVIDATKAILMCLWAGIDNVEAFRVAHSKFDQVSSAELGRERAFAVPTTFSAAEFTAVAATTNPETGQKMAYRHPDAAPQVVVLDPAATLNTPLRLLLTSGIRAVDHAAEAFCSPTANPMTEAYALSAVRLLSKALPAIKAAPEDLVHRQLAQFAMWQSILSSSTGVGTGAGASHAIGYALGASYGVPHGETSCISLAPTLRWNAEVNRARQDLLADAMGYPGRPTWQVVRNLVRRLETPVILSDVGIAASEISRLAERAFTYAPMRDNPRPIASPNDVAEILAYAT